MTATLKVELGEGGSTPYLPLAEVAPLVRRVIAPDPDATYTELGVRSFNKGTFHRRTVKGAEFTWQELYLVRKDDLMFSNIMAWEGAVALAGADDEGCVGNHRMLTCACDSTRINPAFLAHYFKTPEGMTKLVGASPGTVARNRTLTAQALGRMTVPVPPLVVQDRAVRHLEALAEKIHQIEASLAMADNASAALLLSLHHKLAAGRKVRLGDAIELHEIDALITAAGSYPQVGVRGFGGGLFAKGAIGGTETTYRAFHRLYEGAIVLSQVKGWEGAIARCPAELADWFVSPEYRTFRCKPGQASSEYMGEIVKTEWFWQQLQDATRGVGARRERTRPEQFLNIDLVLPHLDDQLRIVEVLKRQSPLKAKHAAIRQANAALLPATLERLFASTTVAA
ncbi:restriction endonuclease subunit S [Roseateles sp.]|uniref:restriction endonuclease subunit S n=1 Tax=Roseateles sp. TaxID=1971397 RepID=UPI0032656387